MPSDLSTTNDPQRRTWVPVPDGSDFPMQNLPYGVFRAAAGDSSRCGVAIGQHVLDLGGLARAGLLPDRIPAGVFDSGSLNAFAALGRPCWQAARIAISRLLDHDNPRLRDDDDLRRAVMFRQADVEMLLPAVIGDYTDFYSSREHATNVGTMFRGKDNALQPNWLHLPVAYHGRASSVVVSGTPIRRPRGQLMPPGAERPVYGLTRSLDFELEMGFFIGPGNGLGEPIPAERAEEHIFGLVLVNDWSARDIQRWEYVPLGPFLAKNFATSISPWVVTLEALEPFRCAGPPQDPEPLEYLRAPGPHAFDIRLEVALRPGGAAEPVRLCRSNTRYLYWNMAQQVAHHTITGCNLRPGDLLASGTISGPTPDSYGSMLELAWKGERPLELPGGETRSSIADGDTVIMTGWAQGGGHRIGFGEVVGTVHGED